MYKETLSSCFVVFRYTVQRQMHAAMRFSWIQNKSREVANYSGIAIIRWIAQNVVYHLPTDISYVKWFPLYAKPAPSDFDLKLSFCALVCVFLRQFTRLHEKKIQPCGHERKVNIPHRFSTETEQLFGAGCSYCRLCKPSRVKSVVPCRTVFTSQRYHFMALQVCCISRAVEGRA